MRPLYPCPREIDFDYSDKSGDYNVVAYVTLVKEQGDHHSFLPTREALKVKIEQIWEYPLDPNDKMHEVSREVSEFTWLGIETHAMRIADSLGVYRINLVNKME